MAVVDRRVAAGGQHDAAGVEQDELTAVHIEADRTVNLLVVADELRDHYVFSVRDLQLLGAVDKRVQQRLAGVIAGEGGSTERLCTEVTLVDLAVVGAREVHPPVFKLPETVRHLFGDRFDLRGVVEEVALVKGVGGVDRPRVLGIAGTQRAVDSAASPRRVGVTVAALAEDEGVLDALFGQLDGRARARGSRADDEYRDIDLSIAWQFVARYRGRLAHISYTGCSYLRGSRAHALARESSNIVAIQPGAVFRNSFYCYPLRTKRVPP